MSLIINIGPAHSSQPVVRAAPVASRCSTLSSDCDTVEFSRTGRVLSKGIGESSFRIARIQTIQAEIQAGTYETPERIRGTVERLLDVLA